MQICFSGSRNGMSEHQKSEVRQFLTTLNMDGVTFHHGDCVGADKEFHDIIRELFPACKIVIHPPSLNVMRAFCSGDESREKSDYLIRNRKMVNECTMLIACPSPSSKGTKYTIDYAKLRGVYVIAIGV